MPRVKKAEEIEVNVRDDNVGENNTGRVVRRGRPPLNKTKDRRRGRPKGSKTKKTSAGNDRDIKHTLREKIRDMKAEMISSRREFREAMKEQKELAKAAQRELKEALRREQALIKLFEKKAKVVSHYADQWTAAQIEKIQTPTKRRRRRRKAA